MAYDYRVDPPVYPGHPVTCALIVLRRYSGRLDDAWRRTEHGWLACEGDVDVPTAGGALSSGCDTIRRVLAGQDFDLAVSWDDARWTQSRAGGHPSAVGPGQEQADRLKPELREMLAAIVAERAK